MNDYEFTFKEDVREKKAAGHGAYAKKGGSKSKRCSLPSDNLTPAQKRALNSEVKTYDLNRPMDWKTFKSMPKDLQEEYIRRIIATFGVTASTIDAELFGNGLHVIHAHAKKKGYKLPSRKGAKVSDACMQQFRAWIRGESVLPGETSQEPEFEELVESAVVGVAPLVAETEARFPLKTATLQMEGGAGDIVQALQLFLCGRSAELEISIKFKEEN